MKNVNRYIACFISMLMLATTFGALNTSEATKLNMVQVNSSYNYDGYHEDVTMGNYETMWEETESDIVYQGPQDYLSTGQACIRIAGFNFYGVNRPVMFFETSIPWNANIFGAVLSIWVQGFNEGGTPESVYIQKANVNYPVMYTSDYLHSLYSGSYGSFNPTQAGRWYNITITDPTNFITKTGVNKVSIRTYSEINEIEPGPNEGFVVSFDGAFNTHPPKLTVYYTV